MARRPPGARLRVIWMSGGGRRTARPIGSPRRRSARDPHEWRRSRRWREARPYHRGGEGWRQQIAAGSNRGRAELVAAGVAGRNAAPTTRGCRISRRSRSWRRWRKGGSPGWYLLRKDEGHGFRKKPRRARHPVTGTRPGNAAMNSRDEGRRVTRSVGRLDSESESWTDSHQLIHLCTDHPPRAAYTTDASLHRARVTYPVFGERFPDSIAACTRPR